jgi:hypothetical protein
MIQRVQSIYLFLSMVFMSLIFFFPIAKFISWENQAYFLHFSGIYYSDPENHDLIIGIIPMAILLIAIPVLSFITIFLYKKRIFQIRLAIYNILLMLGSIGLMYFYIRLGQGKLKAEVFYSFPIVLPLVSAILTYLAYRGIKKDEELVRSYDRIR